MRFIRRTLLLAIVAVGVVAYHNWSDRPWPLVPKIAGAERATQQAGRLAGRAAAKAGDAADKLGDRLGESALTAKIKSKMTLDDHVNARAINVDSAGSVVTLNGTVASKNQRDRALRLARETAGVTHVVDKLQIK